MIEARLMPYAGLKKEPFSGSHLGMRYYLQADPENKDTLLVFVYPEPWCFADTPEEEKEQASFALSAEGVDEACAWLLERFEAEKPRWQKAAREAMHT